MPLPNLKGRTINEPRLRAFMDGLDALRAANPGRPLILYTSFSFSHNYLKLLKQLRAGGALIALHMADGFMCGTVPLESLAGQGYFDALLVSNPYVLELPFLAENYPFDAVHASVGSGSPYVFAELTSRSKAPVIIDYFDFREVMHGGDPAIGRNFGITDMPLELELWRRVFTQAAGIMYLDSPEVVEDLSRVHGHRAKALHFQSYVLDEWLAPAPAALAGEQTRIPRDIVFAGGLHKASQHGHACHGSFQEGIRRVADQGFRFTVVNGCDQGDGQGFEGYLEMASARPDFRYLPAVPNDRLAPLLARHELGWNAQNFGEGAEQPYYYRTLMGSKLYNYLEAGLPCVAAEESAYVARMVRSKNIGLVLAWKDWDRFGEMAAKADWEAIRAGVARARKESTMARHAPRLYSFYNAATGRKFFDMPDLPVDLWRQEVDSL
ncbi:MAG TPA: hypothetical protein VN419_11030 [Humidesulfovibrio sp.]|uniref:hypothetical protein n=1 Tax=Humidesulfovibrio sp. TaxID=2910988 RepID=UPI002CB82F42|nr:hypothetical protein [Humidesulfovibrio sp.]HWR04541.1 hypothetical protein [Humidesulfovibrio sp.]